MLLTRGSDSQLILMANPSSRELKIGSDRLWKTLKSVHQIDENMLLVQDVENNWILTSLDGARIEIPSELDQILSQESCEALSCLTSTKRCKLLLVYGARH